MAVQSTLWANLRPCSAVVSLHPPTPTYPALLLLSTRGQVSDDEDEGGVAVPDRVIGTLVKKLNTRLQSSMVVSLGKQAQRHLIEQLDTTALTATSPSAAPTADTLPEVWTDRTVPSKDRRRYAATRARLQEKAVKVGKLKKRLGKLQALAAMGKQASRAIDPANTAAVAAAVSEVQTSVQQLLKGHSAATAIASTKQSSSKRKRSKQS